jgi:hypothetical protein
MNSTLHTSSPDSKRWQRFASATVHGFHTYGNWLVGITWRRFAVLSVLLLLLASILQEVPPFSWRFTQTIERPVAQVNPDKPKPSTKEPEAQKAPEPATSPTAPAEVPSAPSDTGPGLKSVVETTTIYKGVQITLPPQADAQAMRDAVDQARQEVRLGDPLSQLALLWIVASIILKITYTGRMQAEVKAAKATETAEAESLRRQVLEARVATMQAQVEPHFLFNTLASIDYLIETDPPRASKMQKNLIALLRASMPTMRDANEGGARDLGRELAVVWPYLDILKVRMEERLDASIEVPEGLLSAEFPAMMIQTLVENAIRHGLEPKAEGGSVRIRAEIVHGKLCVTVADTGVGFGNATTAGTGMGLANIRERLQLLYGSQASVTVMTNHPCGTIVTLTVPYKTLAA